MTNTSDKISGLTAVVLLLMLTGCASTRAPSSVAGSTPEPALRADVEPALRRHVAQWEGTPHLLGGTTAAGLDCSAFVQRVYADALQLDLPRITEDQASIGVPVKRSNLLPGDLVFFRPPSKTRHVGIYLSEGEFAHVSSSEGVTVSMLDLPYWDAAYWTSRRVLGSGGAPAAPASGADVSTRDQPQRPAQRMGW